ncbi:hypothetical protein [Mycolicibacterium fortuitum]|uniref:Uncharacterized protein n=1 Tax=Mycolicibacterium fortuitum subsp. fortuitum DSM 46621 = ATCC 6841 = JCM 6387 TaxID=1214102 RepID=K0V9W5_MYCFO|nr:hypothetical protein [Mycolicibacterium fortuitum]AIY44747.1 hypothetical protein G155_03215 [Mycobacterium sp. VKM Ac-1817D]CRL79610.1 hypothetical protein CPGR_02805 [Mycolicibacter nonchromogenicus]EJZ15791.1 hypothetical protein MFORT_02739 [Mycolicibacterium fortuitum subsp. fortuitum DSM 46621 = ATCC 6841 = JCM 6387]WEV33456.1 hypothetical protein OMF10_03295 [Mycolicibacterium fortuitum]CRL54783.1 hypothetical protein CPGR_02080 [Mycolicibacterium fortuitum subsp. fortuitum DSM 46621
MNTSTIERGTMTELVARDCVLFAHIRNGTLYVYRSVTVRDTDEIYQPVIELVGEAEPLTRETVSDPGMMFGQAEVLTYEVAG